MLFPDEDDDIDEDEEDDEYPITEEDKLQNGDRILFIDFSKHAEEEGLHTRQVRNQDFTMEFADVFSAQEFDALPQHRPWDHAIDLTEEFKVTNPKNLSAQPIRTKGATGIPRGKPTHRTYSAVQI